MTVRPPSFPELVEEAATIVQTRVAGVESRAIVAPDGQRVIKTFVRFATVKSVKGQTGEEFTLSFLGGTAEGETWHIAGMPAFRAGDEDFLFITKKATLCPLVGAMHGRYRVQSDIASGRRYIARDNGESLSDVANVIAPMESSSANRATATAVAPLTPEQFEQAVRAEVAHPSRSATPR